MPTVLRIRGYRFHFYSRESLEPPHIHIRSANGNAKFWPQPIGLAEWRGYDHRELNVIRDLVEEHVEEFLSAWNTYFRRT